MQSDSRDETVDAPTDSADAQSLTAPKKSIWAKAKETLTEPVVSKAAAIGKQTYGIAGDATRSALETGMQAYEGSKLQSAVNFIDDELEGRGAKRVVKDSAVAALGKLDQVTGKRLLELLEEKLQTQDAYNDILATRLAEALDRIAKLEARIGGGSSDEH